MYHSIISCTDGVRLLYVSRVCNQPLADDQDGQCLLWMTRYYSSFGYHYRSANRNSFTRWNTSGYLYSCLWLQWSALTADLTEKAFIWSHNNIYHGIISSILAVTIQSLFESTMAQHLAAILCYFIHDVRRSVMSHTIAKVFKCMLALMQLVSHQLRVCSKDLILLGHPCRCIQRSEYLQVILFHNSNQLLRYTRMWHPRYFLTQLIGFAHHGYDQ